MISTAFRTVYEPEEKNGFVNSKLHCRITFHADKTLTSYGKVEISVQLGPTLARCVWKEASNSLPFLARFCRWTLKSLNENDCTENTPESKDKSKKKMNAHCKVCGKLKRWSRNRKADTIVCHINIEESLEHRFPVNIEPDLRWSKRLLPQVHQQIQLWCTMAWLSTLGGAYSALGDHFNYHSEVAGKISISQFYVAFTLGDEGLIGRCRVYMALSLSQRGRFKQAAKIIRSVYNKAMQVERTSRDTKLIASCQAVWNKIKYLKEETNKVKKIERNHGNNGKTNRACVNYS